MLYTDEVHAYKRMYYIRKLYIDELHPYASKYNIWIKYIRINHMDELHSYDSYGWTTSVCCNSYLWIYFIRIQLMDLLYPYVNNTRSTRIPVTKRKPENVYLRPNKTTTGKTFTSTESIPLSTLAKTTTNERNRTTMKRTKLSTQ